MTLITPLHFASCILHTLYPEISDPPPAATMKVPRAYISGKDQNSSVKHTSLQLGTRVYWQANCSVIVIHGTLPAGNGYMQFIITTISIYHNFNYPRPLRNESKKG